MDRRGPHDNPRAFGMEARRAHGQGTTFRSTFIASQSRNTDGQRQTLISQIGGNQQDASRSRRYSQDIPHSIPNWIEELPRDYPQPPPTRGVPPPRSENVQFRDRGPVTPSMSISQIDRQAAMDFQSNRIPLVRGEMSRGASRFLRESEARFHPRRDVQGHGHRRDSLYRPNDAQLGSANPQISPVVNYITTNNNQQYHVDNSRHQRINAQGQVNTQNNLQRTVHNSRRDTTHQSRMTQRLSSSAHQHHRQSHRYREHRG
ncbi:hypothetical protein J7T55_007227 [Diaporthe amygdali]|uniref:uncharacterized protein n=1 Tax=Phomopsis amygdali TaxID=1214568 RepID=UPI0022FE6DAF|nr:uncharacterized protein J7T55_007227 [Diaporthe amygdali]KAJ0108108.1 hypothetical protein J7T55_007227 [Diaporthe amygdali]